MRRLGFVVLLLAVAIGTQSCVVFVPDYGWHHHHHDVWR